MPKLTVHNNRTQVPVISTSRANNPFRPEWGGICKGKQEVGEDGHKYWVKDAGDSGTANEVLGNLIGHLLGAPVPFLALTRSKNRYLVASRMDQGWHAIPFENEPTNLNLVDIWKCNTLTNLLGCDDCHMGNYIMNKDGNVRKIDMQFLNARFERSLTGDDPFYWYDNGKNVGTTWASIAREMGKRLADNIVTANEIVNFSASFCWQGEYGDFKRDWRRRFDFVASKYE